MALAKLQNPTPVLYVRIPQTDQAELHHYSAAMGMSLSRLVRAIIHAKLEEARAAGALRIVEAHTAPATRRKSA